MASRQNSSLTAKEKSSHSKPETKLKHDKSSSNSSTSTPTSVASSNSGCGGGSSGGGGVAAVAAINNVANKRKGASFQITSVSVSSTQHPHHIQHIHRNSTDNNGDDSADDLDDSHTDDNISRITDYETPSISETFSGEDVFFAQQNAAFGTAPVIPTSSQYGLAIVGPDLGGNGANLSDVHVSVTDAGINIMGPISSKQDPDHKNERFKVVKIESTEPFKRGRWMCMDYLDHTTLQAQDDGIDGASSNDDQMTKDEATDETTKLLKTMNNGEIEHVISDNEDLDHEVNKINSHHRPNEASHQHPATMTSIQISNDYSNVNMQQQHHHVVAQSMPQAQIETMFTQEKLHLQHPENQTISEQQQHINPPTSQQQNAHLQQQHAQTMTPEMIHASFMHQEQVTSHHQGVTLPTNLILQNIEQSQQLNSPNNSSNVTLPPPPQQQQQQTTTITLNEHLVDHDGTATTNSTVTNQFQNSQVGDSNRNESEIHSQQQQQTLVANVVNSESVSSPSSSAGPGTVAEGVIVNSNNTIVSEINESAGVNAAAATVGAENDGQTLNEDNESASGTSAVAIDNKIEQAMDLVKSHLMFAVREEVEVLKEKIAELMDRINQLEVENSILKANASQETLSQLTSATVIISPQPPQQQTQQTASPVVPQVPMPQITQQQPQQTPATNQPTQQQQQQQTVVTTQATAQITPNQQQQSTS